MSHLTQLRAKNNSCLTLKYTETKTIVTKKLFKAVKLIHAHRISDEIAAIICSGNIALHRQIAAVVLFLHMAKAALCLWWQQLSPHECVSL